MTHLLMALFASCDSGKDSGGTAPDGDDDGFTTDDCDDAQASIHPGADEVAADGVDQDCDGNDLCYVDTDDDGFGGTATVAAASCDGGGAADNDDDCDDTDAAFHPGAKESCEEDIDYNCDDAVAYEDGDGDEWAACVDCDDKSADVHPKADELVADGIDQDCDGGDGCYADADADGFGSTVVMASGDLDCNDPGEADDSTDCLDEGTDAANTWPGAAESESKTDCMTDADDDGWGADAPAGGVVAGSDCDDTDAAVNCPEFHVGYDVEFSDIAKNTQDYLWGQAVEVTTTITVTDLAFISWEAGTNVKLALYNDAAGGPYSLLVATDSTPVVKGAQEIPVTATELKPGVYWIMAVFDVTTTLPTDRKCYVPTAYSAQPFLDALPDPFAGNSAFDDWCLNYYLVGY
jgi:hypothetical protein